MKPLLVKWLLKSWRELRTREVMVRKGWAKSGLGDVMDTEVQKEAMRQALSRQLLAVNAEGEEEEPDAVANSTSVEMQEELEEDDEVEDDEEEVDIDVCLAAAVEDRPVIGVRRSARLSANAEVRQSLHIAQLLQEQTEEEAVYCY